MIWRVERGASTDGGARCIGGTDSEPRLESARGASESATRSVARLRANESVGEDEARYSLWPVRAGRSPIGLANRYRNE
ncbi:hypothetical protein EL22_05685 [Halostagnicola sp. A56]|nr:hypothetical protein EL22_05685 [Halostagnicola sp. A56]